MRNLGFMWSMGFKLWLINPLSANPRKWSNTLRQFAGNTRWIFWVFLTILLGWRLTLFTMGLFGVAHCSQMGGRLPSLKSVTHILHWWNLAQSYLKKIQKIYKSRDTILEFCWHQHFLTGNQQFLLYLEIQV